VLAGDLTLPSEPKGVVIFAHGSGSSRLNARNRQVAATLNEARVATLLFDLLTEEEDVGGTSCSTSCCSRGGWTAQPAG